MSTLLLRLLTLCSTIRQKICPIQQNSALLNLPLDIFLTITDSLPLHALIPLSQTCRNLHTLLQSRCHTLFQNSPAASRRSCLEALASILPDHNHCSNCRALHAVRRHDLPRTPDGHRDSPCPASEGFWPGDRLDFEYPICHRHVQAAIKYTRLGRVHPRYRQRLLRRVRRPFRSFTGLRMDFVAAPLVTMDHGRFLLKTTHDYRDDELAVSLDTVSEASTRCCPHLWFGWRASPVSADFPENPLSAALRAAFEQAPPPLGPSADAESTVAGSCQSCPTDYEIRVRRGRAIIEAWQDLGEGRSASDPYWRSHIRIYGKNDNSDRTHLGLSTVDPPSTVSSPSVTIRCYNTCLGYSHTDNKTSSH